MGCTDPAYGSMYRAADSSRTLRNVFRGRCTWDQWREHRRYLAKLREDEAWRRERDRWDASLTPEQRRNLADASRLLASIGRRD